MKYKFLILCIIAQCNNNLYASIGLISAIFNASRETINPTSSSFSMQQAPPANKAAIDIFLQHQQRTQDPNQPTPTISREEAEQRDTITRSNASQEFYEHIGIIVGTTVGLITLFWLKK